MRRAGAVPATIAVLDGARPGRPGRRRAGAVGGRTGRDGGQGVPARPAGAAGAGRQRRHHGRGDHGAGPRGGDRLFATGGIGGVHRGGQSSLDVSADLVELGRTPVTVVCAGAKSILDLPRTLEVLETQGCACSATAATCSRPSTSGTAGCRSSTGSTRRSSWPGWSRAHRELGYPAGLLVANPIPEPDELPPGEIADLIAQAVAAAERAGVGGAGLTPFLLGRLERARPAAPAWPRTSRWSGTTPGSRRPPRSRWRPSSRSRRPGPGWPRRPPGRPG